MAGNPVPPLVPCHCVVVRNDGKIGSCAFGAGQKAKLLKEEGVSPRRARRGAARGDPYDRDRVPRHLPKCEADTARKQPSFPRGGSGDLRRVPALQGVPSGGRVKPGSVGKEG